MVIGEENHLLSTNYLLGSIFDTLHMLLHLSLLKSYWVVIIISILVL